MRHPLYETSRQKPAARPACGASIWTKKKQGVHPTIRRTGMVAGWRGFSSGGHRLSSLYRNGSLAQIWLMARKESGASAFFSA